MSGHTGEDRMKKSKWIIIVVAVMVALMAVVMPLRRGARLRNICENRLRQIYAPMRCCVPMANRLTDGDPLDPRQVAEFIRGGVIPRCPCGPEYEIVWKVGAAPPRCPYHGDLIGKDEEKEH